MKSVKYLINRYLALFVFGRSKDFLPHFYHGHKKTAPSSLGKMQFVVKLFSIILRTGAKLKIFFDTAKEFGV